MKHCILLFLLVFTPLFTAACDRKAPKDDGVAEATGTREEKSAESADRMMEEPTEGAAAEDIVAAPPGDIAKKEMKPKQEQEPDPEAPNTEEYEEHGFNPWTETSKDAQSTFAVDVDTGSYTIARKKLLEQQTMPPPASVRVEEFVNYFDYDYPNPDAGPFGVFLEAAPSPFTTKPKRHLLRVGVQGRRISAKERKPVHLTLLVDVSGSMNQQDKLPLAVEALKILTNNLKAEDTIAIATYAGYVEKVLEPTGADNKGAIYEALDSLGAGGGTGMNDGMKLAYEMAIAQKKPGHVSRVIVLSDGDANIGPASHDDILEQIQSYVDEGVTLSTVGLGMGNYKDTMMEQLANKGNGNYSYIDTAKEARRVFGEQLGGTLQVIAKDVKIQVEFDPQKVPKYRLIGYENRDIADEDFRDDKVDAGEIGAGHTVTAFYELELADAPQGDLGVVRVRHKKPDGFKASEQQFQLSDGDFHGELADASTDFQFAASVAAFAELLRDSPYIEGVNYAWVEEIAAPAAAPRQQDRQEFLTILRKAKSLDE